MIDDTISTLADDWGTDPEAIATYIDDIGINIDALDKYEFLDAYQGKWGSFEEFADNFFFEVVYTDLPNGVESYIDIASFAHDLKCEGYWFSNGFVFSPF